MQSKRGSFIEASVNTAIGYIVGVISQIFIFPAFGIYIPLGTDLAICAWFTVISLARSYILRRWFNSR